MGRRNGSQVVVSGAAAQRPAALFAPRHGLNMPPSGRVQSSMRWLTAVVLVSASLMAGAQPARIVLLRHAEKPADPTLIHLTEEGQKRASHLSRWLIQAKVLGTNGLPAALYAAAPSPHGRSVRCVETLQPTADRLSLPLNLGYAAADYRRLAHDLLRDRSLKGKTVVICWVHECLPELAADLGVKPEPPKWKDKDFESVYIITFPEGRASLDVIRQKFKVQ